MTDQTQRINMTTEQAKVFAAELRKTADQIDLWADSIAQSPNPDAYTYVSVAGCVPVRIRIGRDEQEPTAPRPLVVGAKVRVDYPGDTAIGPVTFWGTIEQVLPASCMVRSNHSNTCPNVLNQYITVIG